MTSRQGYLDIKQNGVLFWSNAKMLSRIIYLLVKCGTRSQLLKRNGCLQREVEISVELLVPRALCLKNKIPWSIARNGRGMRGNASKQNKTTEKKQVRVLSTTCLGNNSTESKPAGLSWECCGLASPTELNWNALFVFQQACKSWQRSDQLFKPCWTSLRVQLLYLVRGPLEKFWG